MIPPILLPIPIVIALLFIVLKKTRKKLINKKVFFTGPKMSGKTTMIQMLMQEDLIANPKSNLNSFKTYVPNGSPEQTTYKSKKYNFQITDMGGGENFLANGIFESLIKSNDVIVFVFNCAKYLNDSKYECDVNARLDFIWNMNVKEFLKCKALFFVGSHSDSLTIDITEASRLIFERIRFKTYNGLLSKYPFVLGSLTDKADLKRIFGKLNKELENNK